MNEEQDFKLTDLDYLTGNHHLQMMKAALPYMEVPEQKMLSVFVKINELQRTISLFQDEEVATMGICSLEEKKSPMKMLKAIKPYGNTAEQDLIDLMSNFLQSGTMFPMFTGSDSLGGSNSFGGSDGFGDSNFDGSGGASSNNSNSSARRGASPENKAPEGPESGASMKRSPMEQLKGFLPPEQQSRLETMQMMMQAMQQFT